MRKYNYVYSKGFSANILRPELERLNNYALATIGRGLGIKELSHILPSLKEHNIRSCCQTYKIPFHKTRKSKIAPECDDIRDNVVSAEFKAILKEEQKDFNLPEIKANNRLDMLANKPVNNYYYNINLKKEEPSYLKLLRRKEDCTG
jgi:hypothetical protein